MSKKKGFAAITLAGASMASVVMLQQRGILPKVRVTLDRPHGKHEADGQVSESAEQLQPVE